MTYRLLFAALQRETADEHNFQIEPSMSEGTAVTSQNPYTNESRITTTFVIWSKTQNVGSWLEKLPSLLLQGTWDEALRGYQILMNGLDLWVSNQLRKKGAGTPEDALGNAHQYHGQLRAGLEQIAEKHATRLPALFHPSPDTVEHEKAAGRRADAIPMNVYFWKDAADGNSTSTT
jgi:hypothetical protein